MQFDLAFMEPNPLVEVHFRLLEAHVRTHGPLGQWVTFDPVTQMVHAILDGRTREDVSKRAFRKLCGRFASWDDLRRVSPNTIAYLIRPVTFADNKAAQISAAFHKIHYLRGALSLDFLAGYSVEAARAWLEVLPGVGPKVSAAVVNFSTLGMPALVVDSHYQRIAKRLGFVTSKASDRAMDRSLGRLVPGWMTTDDLQQNYFLVKRHGQTVCHHSPKCPACVLSDLCLLGRRRRDGF